MCSLPDDEKVPATSNLGWCTFFGNNTCGYQMEDAWSVHFGEVEFHRPVIVNGSGKIHMFPNILFSYNDLMTLRERSMI